MRLSRIQAIGSLILTAILSAPALANTQGANSALPGTLNYVEGQANIGTETLDSKSIGSTTLQSGESLTTERGKAEILLTPGVFLRLDSNSSAKMLSPSLTDTEVGIDQGRAMVEVTEIRPQNDLQVRENGASTRLLKTGLYAFDADHEMVQVFDGQAKVQDGDRQVTVKGGHQVALDEPGKLKAEKFDKKAYAEDDLYRFSSLRSSYVAEANMDAARSYYIDGGFGSGWYGSGWYWSPWFGAYTFIPADGIFYSPFGWGFYSPLIAYHVPRFYGSYYRHFGPGYRPGVVVGRYMGPGARSGFHAAPPMRPMASVHAFGGFHGGFGVRR